MIATFMQLVGLGAIVTGATAEYGIPGAIASSGIVLVYVGLALEPDA